MAGTKRDADDLTSTLRSQRLIKIIIGPEDSDHNTVLVQEELLRSISEYFIEALKHDHLRSKQHKGILHFPEDEKEVWNVLLFWMFHRRLSDALEGQHNASLLCRCWTAADKYLIPALQDSIMLELILVLDEAEGPKKDNITLETAKLVFMATTPKSPLRKIVAEELIHFLYEGEHSMEDLEVLDGAVGVARSFAHGYDSYYENRKLLPDRFHGSKWKDYLVSDGPKTHRMFDLERRNPVLGFW